ncbi:MAG: ATP-grasp domain-containing protein [Thiolinea sp.]
MLLPGATIGMLGGGQLGRMFTVEARRMGYRVVVLEPDPLSPAGQLADEHRMAAYDDEAALRQLGECCDVVTTEFENIPAATLSLLESYCPVRPAATVVEVAQDRQVEKEFIRSCGLLPAPFAPIRQSSDIPVAVATVGFPAILKTARLGYDGKGQMTVSSPDEVADAFQQLQQVPCVLEQRVDLACEISVVLARNSAGACDCFPVAENIHRQGILHQTLAPARISPELARSAPGGCQTYRGQAGVCRGHGR